MLVGDEEEKVGSSHVQPGVHMHRPPGLATGYLPVARSHGPVR
jgi:hypothetical protein